MKIGETITVKKQGDFIKAQVLAIRNDEIYVHYVGYNKRLDEWLDTKVLEIDVTATETTVSVGDQVVAQEAIQAADGVEQQPGFDRERELEKLRTSGSMTQNIAEIARVKNVNKISFGRFGCRINQTDYIKENT